MGRRWPWAFALVLTSVGTGLLLFYGAANRPLWLDEEMIALNARDRSFAQLPGPLWLGQAAPLGWLALVRASLLSFGSGERALHVVPVLFGIGTLATAWWVGRRWLQPAGAALLALLCAFGDHLWFFSLELKHYSADAFGGLSIPAVAAWAIEAPAADASRTLRRTDRWWLAAALAQWCSYGALLVTPGCAAVIAAMAWRRDGWTGARRSVLFGLAWAVSVALHYAWSIRFAAGSDYLQSTWVTEFPPVHAGAAGVLQWLAGRFEPLAINPGGTNLWVTFWAVAISGLAIAVATRRALGLVLATVPVSAVTLAACRLVPLSGRLSLWIVPALYVGIAFAADASVALWRASYARSRWAGRLAAIVCGVFVLRLCADVVRTGGVDMATRPPIPHGVDDRAAVRWLMTQRKPGDALLATRLALPAIWWYGGVSLSNSAGHLADEGPLLEVHQISNSVDCPSDELRVALRGAGAEIYFGFDMPDGFDDLALNRLAGLGVVTAYRRFAESSQAAVIDLRRAPIAFVVPRAHAADPNVRPPGCVGIRVAERW